MYPSTLPNYGPSFQRNAPSSLRASEGRRGGSGGAAEGGQTARVQLTPSSDFVPAARQVPQPSHT